MSERLDLQSAVSIAMSALQQSDDFSDSHSVASFMIFMSHITMHSKDIITCHNKMLENVGLVASSIMTTNFVREYPAYYGVSQGEVLCAVGFYTYMKQLDKGTFLDIHYPAFILLLHHGEQYLTNIYNYMLTNDPNLKTRKFSVYNPFDIIDTQEVLNKARKQIRAFEYIIHVAARQKGYYDSDFNEWYNELYEEYEVGEDYVKEAKKMYRFIANDLMSNSPYSYAK
ncbi:MAG: hypothetical protein IJN45_00315 [Alistipes sp.]|nr:hypothetical protein [Alistipes sp.]